MLVWGYDAAAEIFYSTKRSQLGLQALYKLGEPRRITHQTTTITNVIKLEGRVETAISATTRRRQVPIPHERKEAGTGRASLRNKRELPWQLRKEKLPRLECWFVGLTLCDSEDTICEAPKVTVTNIATIHTGALYVWTRNNTSNVYKRANARSNRVSQDMLSTIGYPSTYGNNVRQGKIVRTSADTRTRYTRKLAGGVSTPE